MRGRPRGGKFSICWRRGLEPYSTGAAFAGKARFKGLFLLDQEVLVRQGPCRRGPLADIASQAVIHSINWHDWWRDFENHLAKKNGVWTHVQSHWQSQYHQYHQYQQYHQYYW